MCPVTFKLNCNLGRVNISWLSQVMHLPQHHLLQTLQVVSDVCPVLLARQVGWTEPQQSLQTRLTKFHIQPLTVSYFGLVCYDWNLHHSTWRRYMHYPLVSNNVLTLHHIYDRACAVKQRLYNPESGKSIFLQQWPGSYLVSVTQHNINIS